MRSFGTKDAFPVLYYFIFITLIIEVWAGGVFIGCTGVSSSDKPVVIEKTGNGKIELLKVDSIVLDPGEQMIGRFHEYMKINNKGTVLMFADLMNQRLFLFDRQGKLINTIGSKGSGPKEFLQIISFDVDDGRVVVADESLYMVKIFSLEGELLNSFQLFEGNELVITSFDTHVADQWLYVPVVELKYSNEKSKSAIVAKIDLNTGEVAGLIGKFDPFVTHSKYYYNVHRFAIDNQNQQLVTSINMSPRIQLFDLESKKRIKYFFSKITEWKPLKKNIEATMSRHQISELTRGASQIHSIFVNEYNIFQVIQTQTLEFQQTSDPLTKQHAIAVYDRDGDLFYGTVKLPGLPGALHNNQFFIIEDVNPDQYTIGIYEVLVD